MSMHDDLYTESLTLPPEEAVVDIADFFKVFGDPTRLKILFLLEGGSAASPPSARSSVCSSPPSASS